MSVNSLDHLVQSMRNYDVVLALLVLHPQKKTYFDEKDIVSRCQRAFAHAGDRRLPDLDILYTRLVQAHKNVCATASISDASDGITNALETLRAAHLIKDAGNYQGYKILASGIERTRAFPSEYGVDVLALTPLAEMFWAEEKQ